MRKHPSLILLGSVVIGILLADRIRPPVIWPAFLLLVSALFGSWYWLRGRHRLSISLGSLAIGLFSVASYGLYQYERAPDHFLNQIEFEQRYHIFGEVETWPEFSGRYTRITVRIDSIGTGPMAPSEGELLLNLQDSSTIFQRGDQLEFWSRIYPVRDTPGSSFNYGRYLRLKGIDAVTYLPTPLSIRVNRSDRHRIFGWIDELRGWIRSSFEKNLTPEAAALASGFLIGETRNIPPEIYGYFRDSGTLHLLAVSGSNVAIVLLFAMICLRWTGLRRKSRTLVLLAVVAVFALLSYGEPSVVRASVMAALVLLAHLVERRFDANNLIAAAALIILLIEPQQLFDIGFQLSFITAWGLILTAQTLERLWGERRRSMLYLWIIVPLTFTVAAQFFSAPLIMMYFQRVPLLSLLANIVIIPLVSIIVVGLLVLLSANFILPLLGSLVGAALQLIMNLTMYFLQLFGSREAVILQTPDISPFIAFLSLALLALIVTIVRTVQGRRYALLILLLFINVLGARLVVISLQSKPFLKSDVLKIPGGAAVLVEGMPLNSADLIVTNLFGRDYPVDEKILYPWLEANKIDKIGRVIIFETFYDGLDDMLRIVGKYAVDSILVPQSMLPSLTDAMNSHESPIAVSMVPLGPRVSSQPDRATVSVAEDKYAISVGSIHIVISRKLKMEPATGAIAIVDPETSLRADQISDLTAFSGHLILCSKFAQLEDSMAIVGTQLPAEQTIIDLKHSGRVKIAWPDSLAQPILTPAFN